MKTHLTALTILAVILIGFSVIVGILYLIGTFNPYYLFWVLLLVVLGFAYHTIYKDLKDKEENERLGPFNSGGRD
jgi:4-hydroxybenzoate polyprenyltransferase